MNFLGVLSRDPFAIARFRRDLVPAVVDESVKRRRKVNETKLAVRGKKALLLFGDERREDLQPILPG